MMLALHKLVVKTDKLVNYFIETIMHSNGNSLDEKYCKNSHQLTYQTHVDC